VLRRRWIATLWGFAEATFFFIVPDVFTSRIALTHGSSAAFRACAWSVLGALIGGTILFAIVRLNPSAAAQLFHAFDHIPGISPALIETARTDVAAHGSAAFFTSATAGIPYKVCVLHLALTPASYASFLLMSLLARALRFAAVTSVAALCQRLFLHRHAVATRTRVHFACWAAFYAWYFWTMSA
jgi:membrane protein YqaA with SNARE-associated domain